MTLKTGLGRSVRVEGGPGNAATLVKRIETRGIARVRHARLARAEFAVQQQLFAAGLAVPEPLELRREDGAIELVSRYLAGASSLAELQRSPTGVAAPAVLARRIGELVARAHALGLDHPDLHEKNLLVTPAGEPFVVDFHRARVRPRPSAKVARRDLVLLASATRERVPLRLRQRALAAWWRATAVDQRPKGRLGTFAAALEDSARAYRAAVIERSTRRWLRASSATRRFTLDGVTGIARVELADEHVALLAGWTRGEHGTPRESEHLRRELARLFPELAPLAVIVPRQIARGVREAWTRAVRLEEHAVRAARPLVFVPAPRTWALFALPRGDGFDVAWQHARAHDRARLAASLGALFGTLDDRALAVELEGLGELWLDERGDAWITGSGAVTHARRTRAEPWTTGLALIGDATGSERRAFLDAWHSTRRSSRTEVARG